MAPSIQTEQQNNTKVRLLKHLHNCKVITNEKFSSSLPERGRKPAFQNVSPQTEQSWIKDIEEKIALTFERKDIVEIASILKNVSENPIYIKKTKNSPLYVFLCENTKTTSNTIQEKIGIAETALYLLINDENISLKEVAQAFKLLTDHDSDYKPSKTITGEFHKRLGLFENVRRTEEIIDKLKMAGKGLGFTR